jgi:hypothetical protein
LLSGFVLNDIPVLHENTVLNAENISRDPVHHCPKPGKTPMGNHKVSFSNDQTSFIDLLRTYWVRVPLPTPKGLFKEPAKAGSLLCVDVLAAD